VSDERDMPSERPRHEIAAIADEIMADVRHYYAPAAIEHRHEERVGEVLAGADPDVQGAALAGCLAIWLMGHRGDPDAAAVMRQEILDLHINAVRELIDLYEGIEE
jgi:hypothetical protein